MKNIFLPLVCVWQKLKSQLSEHLDTVSSVCSLGPTTIVASIKCLRLKNASINGSHALFTGPTNLFDRQNFHQNVFVSGFHILFTRLTSLFFSKIFIKNESHDTIHTFKNYFATVFSIFNNKRYPNESLVYYLAYFCYYSQASLHFLVLFMDLTILFWLTFTFIYSIFNKKFSVLTK